MTQIHTFLLLCPTNQEVHIKDFCHKRKHVLRKSTCETEFWAELAALLTKLHFYLKNWEKSYDYETWVSGRHFLKKKQSEPLTLRKTKGLEKDTIDLIITDQKGYITSFVFPLEVSINEDTADVVQTQLTFQTQLTLLMDKLLARLLTVVQKLWTSLRFLHLMNRNKMRSLSTGRDSQT